jgi:hypothetical protein
MSFQPINISMTYKKQHIRLWFECLQICHSQSEYSENLKMSKDFYDEWGDVTNIRFDDWWKETRSIFDDVYVREVSRVSKSPNTITLSIPLNEKISVITAEVKKIVEKRQTEKLIEMGRDPKKSKSKDLGVGKYSFSQKEIKGLFQYINLEVYKIYLSLNKPPINRNFLIEVRKSFDVRSRSQLRRSMMNLPQLSEFETKYRKNVDLDDVIRSVRRSIKGVEKTLMNVSKGKFP